MACGKYEYWLTDDGLLLLRGWARDGLTDEQIAHNAGISRKTLSQWKRCYSVIGTALKKGKEIVDYEVENALLSKALAGDVTAMIFWLKNRKSNKWVNDPQALEIRRAELALKQEIAKSDRWLDEVDDNA